MGTGSATAGPVVAGTREELRAARDALPGRVAVVMTMGALHAGHARLVREARALADAVVVTIFVNPLQFGQGADLDAYPRTLAADVELLAGLGVDLVFAPDRDVVYPGGDPLVRISAGPLGEVLEGASRPGHFDGVLTVVGKLLHLTRADVAVFGQKDAQQLLLVRRMVADLDLGVDVVGVPTVRDADGLALSSRNARLTPRGRVTALALGRALGAGERAAGAGAGAVLDAAGRVLAEEPGVALDHLALVRPHDLAPVEPDHRGPALLAVAAVVDGTRLIDNVPLVLG